MEQLLRSESLGKNKAGASSASNGLLELENAAGKHRHICPLFLKLRAVLGSTGPD